MASTRLPFRFAASVSVLLPCHFAEYQSGTLSIPALAVGMVETKTHVDSLIRSDPIPPGVEETVGFSKKASRSYLARENLGFGVGLGTRVCPNGTQLQFCILQ